MSAATGNAKPMMPPGIPYIIGNEAAERFSFYGMRTILVIYMTKYLMDSSGMPALMSENEATGYFHLFVSSVYFFPLIGALLSDIVFGKYKTIMILSVVYCVGHLALAFGDTGIGATMMEPKTWLLCGLALIAVGSGGIKPCVSAHVGDQFDKSNTSLLSKVFGAFYFSINLGAFVSTLLTPWLLANVGPAVAFGVPGVLMLIATILFWMGRKSFTAVPPAGWQQFKSDAFSSEGLKTLGRLAILYVFIATFWALFDQTGSSWVLQADKMDRVVNFGFGPIELLPSQLQAINPIMIMVFIPIFNYIVYPMIDKVWKLTPLRKIGIGFFIAGASFSMTAIAENLIVGGATPTIMWQVWAYALITAAEVMVSITALEFSYTQAPNSMKSLVMGVFFLSVTLGNIITAGVNFIVDATGGLEGSAYYWFFTGLVVLAGILFSFVALKYKEQTYVQGAGAVPA